MDTPISAASAVLTMEKRQYPRFQVRLPTVFSGDHTHGHGHMWNLSLGGCAVQSEMRVTTGMQLRLQFTLRDRPDPLVIDLATVRWSTGGKFGTEFLGFEPEAQQRLREFIRGL